MDYVEKKIIDDEKSATETKSAIEKGESQDRIREVFSERFKYAIKFRNMNKHQVAQQTGLSSGLLGAYERGEKAPGIDNAKIIANCLGVSLDWLCGEGDLSKGITPWIDCPIATAFIAILDKYEPTVKLNDRSSNVTLLFKFNGFYKDKNALRDFLKTYLSLNDTVSKVNGTYEEFYKIYSRLINEYNRKL